MTTTTATTIMKDVIVLDDDDDFADGPPFLASKVSQQLAPTTPTMTAFGSGAGGRGGGGKGGLTDQQRKRMAEQREIALARCRARENSSRDGLEAALTGVSSSRQTRILDTADYQKKAEERKPKYLKIWPGSSGYGGAKREAEAKEGNGDDAGWRSVRKRPVPGQSFGGAMSDARGGRSDHGDVFMRESSRAADFGKERTIPISVGASTKLEWQKPAEAPASKAWKGGPKPSRQQMSVLKAIRNGRSVFLTGCAGTGKSFVLEYAIRLLKIVHGPEAVFVTASTGLAACALGGTTLHSFAGVGLGTSSKEALVEKVKGRREVRSRWMTARALILDEISMIDGDFFDKLDHVGRLVRNRSQPFGGIQLIVTGDFYQLPPVNPPKPDKYFAFEADCWDRCFDLQVELKTVFRQSDQDFVGMLNEIRRGSCPPSICQRLENCPGPPPDDSGVALTRLYPRKTDVGRENDQNLRALGQPTVCFTAKDEARTEFAKKQLENVRVEKVITLAEGAQVMLAKNLETSSGLVNGARGVVVGFTSPDDPRCTEIQKTAKSVSPKGVWPLVRFASDNYERVIAPESWSITEGDLEVAKRTQIPLLLAWALSVHKCQGMTLDRVETDLSRAFDYGMVYVALSRVKSLEGLRLTGFDPTKIRVHPKVALFYDNLGRARVTEAAPDTFQESIPNAFPESIPEDRFFRGC